MGKSLTMAWRNMWRNWRRTAIELIAIVLGLILLLFMDGLIKGSDQAIFGNPVRLYGGNIQVHAPGFREKAHQLPMLPLEDADAVVQAARAQPQVVAAAKRINTPGLVSSREGAFPGVITGVEPAVEAPLSIQAENVAAGRFLLAEKAVIAALQPALPNYEVDSWETLRPEMRQTMDTKSTLPA